MSDLRETMDDLRGVMDKHIGSHISPSTASKMARGYFSERDKKIERFCSLTDENIASMSYDTLYSTNSEMYKILEEIKDRQRLKYTHSTQEQIDKLEAVYNKTRIVLRPKIDNQNEMERMEEDAYHAEVKSVTSIYRSLSKGFSVLCLICAVYLLVAPFWRLSLAHEIAELTVEVAIWAVFVLSVFVAPLLVGSLLATFIGFFLPARSRRLKKKIGFITGFVVSCVAIHQISLPWVVISLDLFGVYIEPYMFFWVPYIVFWVSILVSKGISKFVEKKSEEIFRKYPHAMARKARSNYRASIMAQMR